MVIQLLDQFLTATCQKWSTLAPNWARRGGKNVRMKKIFLQSASNCLLGHHIQFLGQSVKMCGNELIFASGGESTTFPPTLGGLCFRALIPDSPDLTIVIAREHGARYQYRNWSERRRFVSMDHKNWGK